MSKEQREPIYTEILYHCKSLESVTDKQIEMLKKDQKEVQQALQTMFNKLQEISKAIPRYR